MMRSFWRSGCQGALLVLLGTLGVVSAEPAGVGEAGRERPPGEPRGEGNRPEHRGLRPQVEGFLMSYDQDGDKAVSFEEFRVGKRMQNMSDEGKKRIFDHLDKNGDGKIGRGELPVPREGGPELPTGDRMGDKNRDGKISVEEFLDSDRWKDIAPEAGRGMFKRMDSNGDGFLTPEDFRNRPDGSRPWDRRRPMLDQNALEKLDQNGDRSLSFEEWRQSPRYKEIPEERLQDWFGRMDRNDDGKLDAADRPEGRPPGGQGPDGGPDGKPEGGPRPGAGAEENRQSGTVKPERPE